MTYMVCDADGYALTDGLQDPAICDEAHRVAQSIANRRLESVWLSPSDSDDMGEEIEPDMTNPVVAARIALRDWNVDNAAPAEIAAVFAAIFERPPDEDENAVDLIFAAEEVLSPDEAVRVNKVL